MSDPTILLEGSVYQVNMTLLLSVITISLATMGTLVSIFKRRLRDDEKPGGSLFCKQKLEDLKRIEGTTKDNISKNEELKNLVNGLEKEVGVLKNQSNNTTKNLDEMKQTVKEVASKLDNLLKQFVDWMS